MVWAEEFASGKITNLIRTDAKKSEEKLKKRNSLKKDDKARNSMNINEFLKPAVPARGCGGCGRGWERGGQDHGSL
nr:hypothetical protein CFP56_77844 [Quercus suber]